MKGYAIIVSAIAILNFAAPRLYAEVVTVEIGNHISKNEKPIMTLKAVVEPLNKEALESGLSAEQIKNVIESSLTAKSFVFSERASTTLTIKFTGIKGKSDFSGYLGLNVAGEEKVLRSGIKVHQKIWSGGFLFPYDTKEVALREISNIADIFVKRYQPSDK